MALNNNKFDTVKEKLAKGLELTFKKMIEKKKSNHGFIVVSENGQIKKISASDIKE